MSRKYSAKLKSQNVDLFFLVTLTEKRNICNVNISSKHICLVGCEVGIKHYLGGGIASQWNPSWFIWIYNQVLYSSYRCSFVLFIFSTTLTALHLKVLDFKALHHILSRIQNNAFCIMQAKALGLFSQTGQRCKIGQSVLPLKVKFCSSLKNINLL